MARTTRGEEKDESEDLMILVLIDGVLGREMLPLLLLVTSSSLSRLAW